jgi:glucosamine--fructose-6-phosphate aminotransferase (isomerizing)
MLKEACAASERVAFQLTQDQERFAELGTLLRANPPRSAVTVARGSSDHAAAYLAYLMMAEPAV